MQKKSIVLSDELIEKIEQFAIEERRKFSPTVAILIEKALKEIERNRNRKRGKSKDMDWASFGRALSGTVPIPEGILNRVAMDDSGQIVAYKSPKPLSPIELLDKDKITSASKPLVSQVEPISSPERIESHMESMGKDIDEAKTVLFQRNQGLKEVVLKKEGEKDPSESIMEAMRLKSFFTPAELKEIREKHLGMTTVESPEYHPELNIQSTGGIKTENR